MLPTAVNLQYYLLCQVAANTLGAPEKAHWKNCLLEEAQERALADQFRAVFGAYDFTMQE
jgi:hypothetical protein